MRKPTARGYFEILALLFLLSQSTAFAQLQTGFANVTTALSIIRQNYKVRIGFEVDDDATAATADLSSKDIRSALDSLVAHKPTCTWSLEDGVYDFYPRSQTEALSDLSITSFVLSNGTLEEARDALFDLPEVRNWLSQHGAIRNAGQNGSLFVVPGVRPEPQRVSLSLANVQLRSILNQLIMKFSREQWVIGHVVRREYGKDVHYVSIEP